MPLRPFAAAVVVFALGISAQPMQPEYFVPAHRLPGIGAGRQELTGEALLQRTDAMIQSQTFSIMREPQALAGALRIHSPGLQRLFRDAARKSGFPAATLEAIAYLESWGIPNAESPAGPRGIMQISEATGRRIGLRISYARRHRSYKVKTAVRNKHGKLVYRTVRHKETYTVLAKDDRLKPEKAIPAAAVYLAGMEQRFGGRDWAIWAYHCGEGCVSDFRSMTRETSALNQAPTVAQVFFGCSPVWNRELCQAIHAQMERDYSPTYWFRVMRAEQLLALSQEDPAEFQNLAEQYKYHAAPAQRAPDRLSAWLKPQELIEQGSKLVSAPDDPGFFGYRVAAAGQAFPATLGTLAYIAFETRRLFDLTRSGEQTFVPLEVTALVLPMNAESRPRSEHASGQVFDISEAEMPAGERECLRFVLDDLGWFGYLGFIEEPPGSRTLHIGCSPASRDFFAQVFEDAEAAARTRTAPAIPAAAERP
jgi:soluble lytic murein transglycosylase-like protein